MSSERSLLFVYNADSGKINALVDIAHKFLSPQTYSCALCQLTHDTLRENKLWKNFREKQSGRFQFLHKDEFIVEHPNSEISAFPVVLHKSDTHKLHVLLTPAEISQFKKTEDLIFQIEYHLERL